MEITNGVKDQTASNFTKINIMIRNTHILLLTIALFCTISACVNKPQTKTSETMYCRYCGKQIPVDSKYCQYCGEQLNNDAAPSSNKINGHEYVDLGLSVKWATCNVGAKEPSDYGDYYAWGEREPKSEYTEENSVTMDNNIGSIAGNPTFDVATAHWGSLWRMPTNKEIYELIGKCKRSWTTQGGHNGCKFICPNGNSIFLPAAGVRWDTSFCCAGEYGEYWSATPLEDDTGRAFYLSFGISSLYMADMGRHMGRSVRPVTE